MIPLRLSSSNSLVYYLEMKPDSIRTSSFVADATDFVVVKIKEAIAAKGYCIFGLAGGKTPQPIYMELAKRESELDWKHIFITFSDERSFPPDSPESNYYSAKKSFLDAVPIPAENVYRMLGEIDPAEAAAEYEKQLYDLAKKIAVKNNTDSKVLQHDLLILGIGDDGHTASLFPETKALSETKHLVVANFVSKINGYRITLCYPLINASRHICFLVSDHKKDQAVQGALSGDKKYLAAQVTATESLTWFIGV